MKLKFENIIPGVADTTKLTEKEYTEDEIAHAFGKSLRTLRDYKKLSLRQLSKEVDINNPTISRYESGYNLPLITQAMKIAGFFDLSIETMVAFGLMEMEGGNFESNGQKINIITVYEQLQTIKKFIQNNPIPKKV